MGNGFPRTVTIYGTGLIGNSFALALEKAYPGIRISGVDGPEILKLTQITKAVPDEISDLVILSTPVGEIIKLLGELKPGSQIILDVGSTKVEICKKAEVRKLPFVGGHPMTGSERSGPQVASPELFRDSGFFLCPVSSTPPGALEKIAAIVRAIGATPHVISPENHDKVVAAMSHLPQILSTLLADHTSRTREFAGPGWKSVTRLAASPFHVWRDILVTSGALPDELRIYIRRLHEILDALERKDLRQLEAIFARSNRSVLGEPPIDKGHQG